MVLLYVYTRMKKIILLIFLFLFFQKNVVFAASDVATDSSNTKPTQINYELAYPGMLPDNPLYFLKAFRDRVIGFLINDPLKKAEFDLLTSDKKLSAGELLFEKKKDDLAVSTISKSNNYFAESISKLTEAKKMREDTAGLAEKQSISVKKHMEVIWDLQNGMDKKYGQSLSVEYKRLEGFEKEIRAFRGKN